MSAFESKTDIALVDWECPLLTQSGHRYELFVDQLAVAFMQTCDRKDAIPIYIATGWYHDKTAASQK